MRFGSTYEGLKLRRSTRIAGPGEEFWQYL